jgi:hypothetical protein
MKHPLQKRTTKNDYNSHLWMFHMTIENKL